MYLSWLKTSAVTCLVPVMLTSLVSGCFSYHSPVLIIVETLLSITCTVVMFACPKIVRFTTTKNADTDISIISLRLHTMLLRW